PLARLAAECEIGEEQWLCRVEVPVVAGRHLIVPRILSVARAHGEDRCEIQIVAATGAPQIAVPRGSVARAEVDEIEIGIVDDWVPRRAAAARFPELSMPRLGRGFERRCFESLRRIAGDAERSPRQLPRLGVEGGHISAHAEFSAGIADDNATSRDARRAGDRVGLRLVDCFHVPYGAAAVRVDGDETPVERREIELAAVEGEAAVHRVAADRASARTIDVWIVRPELAPGGLVVRVRHAPRARGVNHAIDDDRRRLDAASRRQLVAPNETEAGDGRIVDLFEGAESLLAVGGAVGQPVWGMQRR